MPVVLAAALLTAIVSIADLVASVIINSPAVALMSIGLCVLGLILLVIDTVRGRRRLDFKLAKTEQARDVELRRTAGDYLFGEPEVAREIAREERVLSRDMLGYAVPHDEVIIDTLLAR